MGQLESMFCPTCGAQKMTSDGVCIECDTWCDGVEHAVLMEDGGWLVCSACDAPATHSDPIEGVICCRHARMLDEQWPGDEPLCINNRPQERAITCVGCDQTFTNMGDGVPPHDCFGNGPDSDEVADDA